MPRPKCGHLVGKTCTKLDAKCLELRWLGGCMVCPFRGCNQNKPQPTPQPRKP